MRKCPYCCSYFPVYSQKVPRQVLRRSETQLVVASELVSVNFFFSEEVLGDNFIPAAEAASCSSQQWEKEAGRRAQRGPGVGWATAGGGKNAQN